MTKRRNNRKAASKARREQPGYVNRFRQSLFGKNPNYRQIFSDLKHEGKWDQVFKIGQLFSSPNNPFHPWVYGLPFTRTYGERCPNRLVAFTGDLQKELNWVSVSILTYASAISGFVGHSLAFQRAFLLGNYQRAQELLDTVIQSYGVSLWTMDKTFLLKERVEGLEANKRFLTELVGDKNSNVMVTYLANYVSMRAETKISPESYRLALNRALDFGPDYLAIRDYLLYRLDHVDVDLPTGATHIAFFEASSTVIDRYLTFIALCQHSVSKGGQLRQNTCEIVKRLAGKVIDPRIDALLQACDPVREPNWNDLSANVLQVLDLYTSGDYRSSLQCAAQLLVREPATYELYYVYLHSLGYLEQSFEQVFPANSPAAVILERLNSLIIRDSGWRNSTDAILKMAITLWHEPIAYGLYHSYVEETRPNPGEGLLKLALLNASHLNPRFAHIFDDAKESATFLDGLGSRVPDSSTIRLIKRLKAAPGDSSLIDLPATLPASRRTIYRAVMHESSGRFQLAVTELNPLMKAIDNAAIRGAHLLRDRVTSVLFRCFLKTNALGECTDMVVRNFLGNPLWVRKLPLVDLVGAIEAIQPRDVMRKITYPILYSIVHAKPRFIYVAYDNFLSCLGVSRPTELIERSDIFDSGQLKYFLRNVCTIEVLAGSYHFSGTSDLERSGFGFVNISQTWTARIYDCTPTRSVQLRRGRSFARECVKSM